MHSTSNHLLFLFTLSLLAPTADGAPASAGFHRFGDEAQAAEYKRQLSAGLLAGQELNLPQTQAADPALSLEADAVRLRMDAFGSFGSSTAGTDAYFDDGRLEAGTVFEYMVHAKGLGFLDGDALLLPQHWASVERDGDAVVSTYELGAFVFEVRSELLDCDQPNCAWLVQDWTVTNQSADAALLELTPYLDGDLFFSGDFGNDYGARSGNVLYQFDEGSDPAAPSTYLGLSSEAPDALRVAREVGEYSELRRRLKQGGYLFDRFSRADGSRSDLDDDQVTDAGFDVSLAASHDFGELAPGESVQMSVKLQWGLGALDELDELIADAGPDQLLECEGDEGTLVQLDASASAPVEGLSYRWLLDGELVAADARAELMLLPGDHELLLEVEDAAGRVASDDLRVQVLDTTAPLAEVGEPVVLWPPNHRMVEIVPPVRLFDACGGEVELSYTAVLVDEAMDALGDGRTEADALVDEQGRLFLRAERSGRGDGRVYKVLARAADDSGNAKAFTFEVHVPHSQSEPAAASAVAAVVPLR